MNKNIVKKIDLAPHTFAYKVKDPVYDLWLRGPEFNAAPFIPNFGEGKNKINETVIPFFFAPQYFHNFLEVFPKLIRLKQEGEDFKVLLVTNYEIDKDKGLPEILIEGSPANISSDKCNYLKKFYNHLGIEVMFISFDDFKLTSFEYSYVFYEYPGNKFGFSNLWHKDLQIECKDIPISFSQDLFLEGHPTEFYIDNIEIMKSFFPEKKSNVNKKIYISRKNFFMRKIKEEFKLEEYMAQKGYEIVYLENYSVEDQIEIIKESSEIVCLSGSSLVNCMLANPGTKIIEMSLDDPPIVYLYSEMFKRYKIEHTFIHIEPNVESIIKSLKSNGI